MIENIKSLRQSFVTRLIVSVGLTLMVTIAIWAYFNIKFQQERMKQDIAEGVEKLSDTIKLGTHYAMMLNSRDDINQIINNIGRQRDIETIRLYNKEGQIKFSNQPEEVDRTTNIKAEACDICHRSEPPLVELGLQDRTRIFQQADGQRRIGIISAIYNEPGCSTSSCHFHPADKKVLGALDVVVSMEDFDQDIAYFQEGLIGLAIFVFLITSAIIIIFVFKFIKEPVNKLIDGTLRISRGDYSSKIEINGKNEVQQLAQVINKMGEEIGVKQEELNRQKDEYQNLFETVPCIVTVQDRNYRLVQYNREFAEKFDPEPGDFCFRAYKGRSEKCIICPVEKTFEDGQVHTSEETGLSRDGTEKHWLVKTSPIKNTNGEIIAAMEMNLDITQRKQLEKKLAESEKKYHGIFNNIPNPVFVLDEETLQILDYNDSMTSVYGYNREEISRMSFLDLFNSTDRIRMAVSLRESEVIDQIKQVKKDGQILYVSIRVSPSEFPGQRVLLVTTSDITKRLETEQQLIQASKMATLGEMATGVAHELNQPLAVIKTASSYFMKKVRKKEPIAEDIMMTMSEEIDSHVDRASKIINHMRQFGRKSDLELEEVQVNDALERTFEIFSQQLKVRGIDVTWQTEDRLPTIMADTDRLEQVFINLLINARDAIMDRLEAEPDREFDKKIFLHTHSEDNKVIVEVCDSGVGIPAAILDKIFEPFFTTKQVGKGTGLGLSISYGIVQDFGGTIQAARHEPKGTCFIIEFPCKRLK